MFIITLFTVTQNQLLFKCSSTEQTTKYYKAMIITCNYTQNMAGNVTNIISKRSQHKTYQMRFHLDESSKQEKLICGVRNLKLYNQLHLEKVVMEKKPMRDFLGLFIFCFLIWVMVPRCIQFVRIYQTYVYLKYVHFSVCIIYFYNFCFFK